MVTDPVLLQLAAELFPNGSAGTPSGATRRPRDRPDIRRNGHPAGASTFLESTLSYVSGQSRFQQYVGSRDWRLVFTAGIILGGLAFAATFQSGLVTSSLYEPGTTGQLYEVAGVTLWTTNVQPWRLFLGGILVGVGTRIGKGCTSGHGVCGVGSASKTSLVGVLTFLTVAIGTAQAVAALG